MSRHVERREGIVRNLRHESSKLNVGILKNPNRNPEANPRKILSRITDTTQTIGSISFRQ